MKMKRIPRRTIAWWIRHFGFKIELWNPYMNRWGRPTLFVAIYKADDPYALHEFYF